MSPLSPFKNLLAIDIGNTSTLCGFFNSARSQKSLLPSKTFRIPTSFLKDKKSLNLHWGKKYLKEKVDFVAISSVVPEVNSTFRDFLTPIYQAPVQFISFKSSGVLKIGYKIPKELGADRIVNGRGAMAYSSGACVVVDFGTATTFDCLSKNQKFMGGIIAPGPIISAEALYQRTAKLPLVKLSRPVPIIGRNTQESILAGLYHGYRGLVIEIVRRLREKLGPKTTLLATGGQAPLILKGIPFKFKYLPFLTLTGIFLIWKDEIGKKVVSHRRRIF